jgi:hypothetical protein
MNQDKKRIRVQAIDLVMAVLSIVAVGTGVFLWFCLPQWFGWYVGIFNLRNWPPRVWVGLVASLIFILFLIRFWPQKHTSEIGNPASENSQNIEEESVHCVAE